MTTNHLELTHQAIEAALNNQWSTAIDLNLSLLNSFPNDISTLNRLARAYEESGETQQAIATYERVLKLDKYSRIALNNLERLKHHPKGHQPATSSLTNFSFIEEPGRTKTVSLTKLAPKQDLALARPSLPVSLKANARRIQVVGPQGHYLGSLPDDLAVHLIKLLKLGNHYIAAIKTITPTSIEIFIRETKRSARLRGLPSFPAKDTKYYYQFLPTEPISEPPLELVDSEYVEI